MTKPFSILLPALVLAGTAGHAQEGGQKLTKRQIKVQERKASEAFEEDYQKVLDSAHQLFKKKQFEAAVARYQDALQMKPGDSYAIAKITDLRIIIEGLREEPMAAAPAEHPLPEPKPEQEPAPVQVLPEKTPELLIQQEKEKPAPAPVQQPAKAEPEIKEEPKPAPASAKAIDKTSEEFQIRLAQQYPEGVTEETYKEGSAIITKRIVVKSNRGNEYKRAVHGWGGTFYFKNDQSITERIWNAETEIK